MKFVTYLEQMETACGSAGITLTQAARALGMPHSTPIRWRKGEASPSVAAAARVIAYAQRLSEKSAA